jgi:hypothetical protein
MQRCFLAAVKGGDVPEGQGAFVSKTVCWVSPCGARDLRHRLSALGKEEIISSTDRQSCNVAGILAVETSAKEA